VHLCAFMKVEIPMYQSPNATLLLVLLGLVGCGTRATDPGARSSNTVDIESAPPKHQEVAQREPNQPVEQSATAGVSQDNDSELKCDTKQCALPVAAVSGLCRHKNPDAAVRMFAADTAWQREYVRVKEVEAVNTLGPSGDTDLLFDEEVIVLDGASAAKEQMRVSGTNGHHVLRLDGTCATLMDDELTAIRPPAPHHAPLRWSSLDARLQGALLEDEDVKTARDAERSICKGSTLFSTDTHCAEAAQRLTDAIEKAIRRPLALPEVSLMEPVQKH
jgi:hypothetical protein